MNEICFKEQEIDHFLESSMVEVHLFYFIIKRTFLLCVYVADIRVCKRENFEHALLRHF